ncbi:MAG: hypothetical protein R3C70_09560 [Geminicoccaceae bacterium]
MNNDVLAVDSDYNTYSTTASMALTGTVGYGRFEFWPELALIYGRNDVGSIDMSGHAYGLTDHGLDLDVGAVSIGRATFTPNCGSPSTTTPSPPVSHCSNSPRASAVSTWKSSRRPMIAVTAAASLLPEAMRRTPPA